MARSLVHRTLTRISAAPILAALAFGTLSCSSEPSEESSSTNESFTRLLYVVRQHTVVNGDDVSVNVAGGMGQVMDYLRYVPGARLEVRNLQTGDVTNIIAGEQYAKADISSAHVSFDGKQVAFSMKLDGSDDYHIYVADIDKGAEGHNIRQLTFGPYDDMYPIWVAGGRIAFVTNQPYTEMGTRADEYNHARIVTQIATVTSDFGDADRQLCSQNLSHTINLFSLKDGRIGFSRWEHLENVNDVKLFAMNPDCTQMVAVGGQHGKPGNSLVQISEGNEQNTFLGVTTSRENTIQSGALVRIDARADHDHAVVDEEDPEFDVLTPQVPRGEDPSPAGRYRYPIALPDGQILTSWSDGFVNELDELALNPPDFGVYIYDPATRSNRLIVNYEETWELYAQPVVARTEPPVIAPINDSQDSTVPTKMGSIDVKLTSLFAKHGNRVSGAQFEDTPMDEALAAAKKVRIIEGFSSEAATGATMFGLTMAEGAAILGEAEVQEDGSWLAEIPPFVPVHLQPIDEFDLAIRNQTTWIQGMPGESRVCGGCHESRTDANLPGGQALTIAASKGAENFVKPVLERVEYPWAYADDDANPNEIQKIFDASCVSCHNETTNGNGAQQYYTITMNNDLTGESTAYQIPRMDLTSRPITVTYDNETKPWPASYVSIFYPAAMEMEMGMGLEVMGEIPPKWGIPSDARGSALIEKLNITSFLDPSKHAWTLGEAFSDANIAGASRSLHPENVGGTLSREDRVKLIRAIDMGGQFYARQNTGFQPFDSDPTVTGGTQY